jgi:hypothetical protein
MSIPGANRSFPFWPANYADSGGGSGPSSSNISQYGTRNIAGVELPDDTPVELFQIDSTYFPNSNSSYLLTVDWSLTGGTCSNVSGNVSVQVKYNTLTVCQQGIALINQSTWISTDNLLRTANQATTFIPNDGAQPLTFYMVNNTSGSINTAPLQFNISITGLTTSNVEVNNWPAP